MLKPSVKYGHLRHRMIRETFCSRSLDDGRRLRGQTHDTSGHAIFQVSFFCFFIQIWRQRGIYTRNLRQLRQLEMRLTRTSTKPQGRPRAVDWARPSQEPKLAEDSVSDSLTKAFQKGDWLPSAFAFPFQLGFHSYAVVLVHSFATFSIMVIDLCTCVAG